MPASSKSSVTPSQSLLFWHGTWGALDPFLAYRTLKLRQDVFIMEQACLYQDLDGLDLEESTQHVVAHTAQGRVIAALRILATPHDATTVRIGRVVSDPAARGLGAGRACMELAMQLCRENPVVTVVELSAQSYAQGFYEKFGFRVCGPEFLEDDIVHVPMRADVATA